MPKVAVDSIEELSHKVFLQRFSNGFIRLRADIVGCWQKKKLFQQIMAQTGEVYRELGGRKTVCFEYQGRAYFIKLHYGVGWREILKNLFQLRLPVLGAKNEWLAKQCLEHHGVETMKAVGYGVKGLNPARCQSFIITEALPKTISLEDYCRNWYREPPNFKLKLNLTKKVAEVARTLHCNGINHRDFYICHFLLALSDSLLNANYDELTLYLIDLHRVQIRSVTPTRWVVKDMGSLYYSVMELGLSKRDIYRFMKYYRLLPLKTILKDEGKFWQEVEKRGIQLYQKAHKRFPNLALEY